MRRVFLIAIAAWVLMASVGCTMWSAKAKPGWKQATSAEQINRLLWEDVAAQRWDSVKTHIAPLAVLNSGAQAFNGAEPVIAHVKELGITGVQLGDVQSQPAGDELVTTYILNAAGGKSFRVLAVWHTVGKQPIAVALSIAPAQEALR